MHKRVSSSGYQQIQGDLEVQGNILGPTVTGLATAIAKLAATTTTPVKLAAPVAEGQYRSVILRWTRQYNLSNLDYYMVQVSEDDLVWYSLGFDGSTWGGDSFEGTTRASVEMLVHPNIPSTGTMDAPAGRTLYYRVCQYTKAGVQSAWSDSVSATTKTVQAGDLGANSVYANNVVAGFLNAVIAIISGELILGASYDIDLTPSEGDQKVVMDNNEFALYEYNGGTWVILLRIGGNDQLKWYLQARGLIKTGTDIGAFDFGDPMPSGFKRFTFDNTYIDESGADIWEHKGASFIADALFRRPYSLQVNDLVDDTNTYVWTAGTSCSVDLCFGDTAPQNAICFRFNHGLAIFEVRLQDLAIQARINKDDGTGLHSIELTPSDIGKFNHISAGYDASTDKLYLIVNGIPTQSVGAIGGAWNGGLTKTMRVGEVSASNDQRISDLIVKRDGLLGASIAASITKAQAHYTSGQPWSYAGIDALLDLLIMTKAGGKIRLLSSTEYYSSVAGEPSLGTPHPHECYLLPEATVKTVGTYTIDVSGEVPAGATMMYFTGTFQSATINAEVYVESYDGSQVACHSYIQAVVSVATLVGLVRLDSSRRFRIRVVTATVILYEFKSHFYFG